jgi:hypothetical protein
MRRVALALLAAVVIYFAIGASMYQRDVATDWCSSGNRHFEWLELGFYAGFWPYRLGGDSLFCD